MNKGYVAIVVIVILALVFFAYHGKGSESSVVSVAGAADKVVADVKDVSATVVSKDDGDKDKATDAKQDAAVTKPVATMPASGDGDGTDAKKDAVVPTPAAAIPAGDSGDVVEDKADTHHLDPVKTDDGDVKTDDKS